MNSNILLLLLSILTVINATASTCMPSKTVYIEDVNEISKLSRSVAATLSTEVNNCAENMTDKTVVKTTIHDNQATIFIEGERAKFLFDKMEVKPLEYRGENEKLMRSFKRSDNLECIFALEANGVDEAYFCLIKDLNLI